MKSLVVSSLLVCLTTGLVAVTFSPLATRAQEPKQKDIRPFMRQKLKHAQFLMEGLANEDFDLIRDNARALRKLGEDAQWKLSPNLTYVKYAAEFASITDELERRAKEKDLNGGNTLVYQAHDQLRGLPQVFER